MPLDPVEFVLNGDTFRHTPLPSIPLAREHHKLLVRLDHDSGALNTLAFTFETEDFAEIQKFEAAGVFRLIKVLSMLIGTDQRRGAPVDEDADPDAPVVPPAIDDLPRTLEGLYLYYAKLGHVQQRVDANGRAMWVDLQTEDQFNELPVAAAPPFCAWQVLRGLFVPFADLLRGFAATAKEQTSTAAISMSAETS